LNSLAPGRGFIHLEFMEFAEFVEFIEFVEFMEIRDSWRLVEIQ
jgi:hypothetical protein